MMIKTSLILILAFILSALISYIGNKTYLNEKKKHKEDIKSKVKLTTYKDDIEFLLFTINFHTTMQIRYQTDVKGIKNINSKLFTELLTNITKDSYAAISEEYKLILLNYFSVHGLNQFLIKNIEISLRDYITENNLQLQ